MKNVDYAGMFVKEFHEVLEENPTAWVPIGLLEWHGEHIALGCDFVIGQEICRLLARTYGGIVLPPTYFSSPGFSGYEGTIDFPREVASPILTALLKQLEKVGFKTVVLLSSHGGSVQEKMVAKAADDYRQEGSVRVLVVFPGALFGTMESPPHATVREAAVLQHLHPEAVDVSRFTPGKEYEAAYLDLPRYRDHPPRPWRIGTVDVREAPLADIADQFLEKVVKGVGDLLKA
ncbi:MAG: creatininase family protein [Armatimonadetes bacterium]|nr:creatininase family protein [Armatimonadota bacterium]